MTRGKIIFIDGKGNYYQTLEFNGDMYPEGHGETIIEKYEDGIAEIPIAEMAVFHYQKPNRLVQVKKRINAMFPKKKIVETIVRFVYELDYGRACRSGIVTNLYGNDIDCSSAEAPYDCLVKEMEKANA